MPRMQRILETRNHHARGLYILLSRKSVSIRQQVPNLPPYAHNKVTFRMEPSPMLGLPLDTLTTGAFRARAYTLLNPLSVRTSREALLSVCFDEAMFERCSRHLMSDFRQFTTSDTIFRTGMHLLITEATIHMLASRFSDCGHQAHLGCIGLYLVANCLRMEGGNLPITQITCPTAHCNHILSNSLFRAIRLLIDPLLFHSKEDLMVTVPQCLFYMQQM